MFFKKKVHTRSVIDFHTPTLAISPGAESFAFGVNTQLPLVNARGNGTRSGSFRLMQQPQVYVGAQAVLNGTSFQHGQFFSTPLTKTGA